MRNDGDLNQYRMTLAILIVFIICKIKIDQLEMAMLYLAGFEFFKSTATIENYNLCGIVFSCVI